jgi:phospholipase/carboxylesterase
MGFGESRAWWMIDLEKLNRDLSAGRPRDASGETPKGLAEARERVVALLDEVSRRLGGDPKKTVLGGFSQGAMLACDIALRTDRPFAGLVLLSGTLLARQEWAPLMPKRKGLKVLQSHGRADPLLPFFLAEQLRDLLTQAGLSVEWVAFRGAHEIPEVVLTKLGTFLRDTLAR